MELKQHFITVPRPYREGTVEVLCQRISSRHVTRATLSITALGVYEAELNGEKVGDAMFAPGFTYYPATLYYQTWDVTRMLTGEDTLTVYLGQGWYCGRFTFDNKTQIYGECPAVSWMLALEDDTGTRTLCSDDASVEAIGSPYVYAGLYDGEIYKETREQEILQPVRYPGPIPQALEESTQFVRIREEMPVRAVTRRDDVTILDFGQNFAGILEIDPGKMEGASLKLRHGEILKEDGSLYTANLRKAKAEIVYHR